MSILLPTRRFLLADGLDADARRYIRAVEAADGQALEPGVRRAYDQFVRGCKADGIWSAIKASCILAGARTLSGALVPLVGTAPTNFNFVSGDYDRKTGLTGDGATKYLDSNRNNNADPQNSQHLAVYATSTGTTAAVGWIGSAAGTGSSVITRSGTKNRFNSFNTQTTPVGFKGHSRSESSQYLARSAGTDSTYARTSQTPLNSTITVFLADGLYGNSTLASYSIGESLDLALLDTRVTTLINAIAAAIP